MRVGLAEAAHSLGVPGPQHGGNHSRENRRKYRQKRENTTKMSAKKRLGVTHPTGLGVRRGFH